MSHRTTTSERALAWIIAANVCLAILLVALNAAILYAWSWSPSDLDVPPALAAEVQSRLAAHSDEILAEAEAIANEIVPPLTAAVASQWEKDYPRYVRTVQGEGSELMDETGRRFLAAVRERYRGALAAHRAALAEELPDRAKPADIDRLMASFEAVAGALAERYYLDEFQQAAAQTQEHWAAIDPLPPPRKGDPTLAAQLNEYVADWVALQITDETKSRLTRAAADATDASN